MNTTAVFCCVLVLSLLTGYIYLLAKRYTMAKIETFESEPAYVTKSTREYDIRPFQKTPRETQNQVIQHFNSEWQDKTGVTYSEQFVKDTWKYPDALYVMTEKESGALVGTTALDRQFMSYPFISHIYVTKEHRKQGRGEELFSHILEHAKKVGYKFVRGFCEDNLVPYYEKFGAEPSAGSSLLKAFIGMTLMSMKVQ